MYKVYGFPFRCRYYSWTDWWALG